MRHLLFLLLFAPTLLSAQDRIGTRLAWGTVEVIIYPSRALGMQLSVTTAAGSSGRAQQAHGLGGGFDPDSVFAWVDRATGIITPGARPSGPDVLLLTPVLRSADGDSIRLMRRPKGDEWERNIAILFDGAGPKGDHFDVLTGPGEVGSLLAGLQREAGLSGYYADSVAALRGRGVPGEDSLRADDIPSVLSLGKIRYPDRSKRGKIIVEFVVQADGRADPESIRTIYAEYAVFQEWAKAILTDTRFNPGKLRGQPVAVLVRQAINFTP